MTGQGRHPLPVSFNDVLHFLLNFLRRRETTSADNAEEGIWLVEHPTWLFFQCSKIFFDDESPLENFRTVVASGVVEMSFNLSAVEPRRSVSLWTPFRLAAVDNTDEVGVPGDDLQQIQYINKSRTVRLYAYYIRLQAFDIFILVRLRTEVARGPVKF